MDKTALRKYMVHLNEPFQLKINPTKNIFFRIEFMEDPVFIPRIARSLTIVHLFDDFTDMYCSWVDSEIGKKMEYLLRMGLEYGWPNLQVWPEQIRKNGNEISSFVRKAADTKDMGVLAHCIFLKFITTLEQRGVPNVHWSKKIIWKDKK